MKITELLKRDTVIMNLTASNKEAVIDELVEKLNGANRLNSKAEFKEAILKGSHKVQPALVKGLLYLMRKQKLLSNQRFVLVEV